MFLFILSLILIFYLSLKLQLRCSKPEKMASCITVHVIYVGIGSSECRPLTFLNHLKSASLFCACHNFFLSSKRDLLYLTIICRGNSEILSSETTRTPIFRIIMNQHSVIHPIINIKAGDKQESMHRKYNYKQKKSL